VVKNNKRLAEKKQHMAPSAYLPGRVPAGLRLRGFATAMTFRDFLKARM
jgi:hypothetical protein